MMKESKTNRGFHYADFYDRNNEGCSLQKSSIADEDCIWLGIDRPKSIGGVVYGRMHLTQEMVMALLPYLNRFAYSGEIKKEQTNEEK